MTSKKNAIILAAGLGSRFVPITYDIPKGLIEVNGERMIERQIKQLKSIGVDEIYLISGYMSNKFKYLEKLYNIKIIKNNKYKEYNNLYSLYLAKEHLDNTYILSSDNYIINNIFNVYEHKSWYAASYSSDFNHEWYLDFDNNGKITNIYKSGKNAWHMYGPVYLNSTNSKILKKLLEIYIKREDIRNLYWEDILYNHIEEFDIYINKRDDIFEFESFEELRVFDTRYLNNSRNKYLNLISKVMDVSESEIYNILPIKEGMTNNSFKFDIKDHSNSYIFRVPGNDSNLLVNRINEYNNYKAIKSLEISDKCIYFDKITGLKISEYIYATRTININDNEDKQNIIKTLKLLHNSNIKFNNYFNIFEKIDKYEKICLDNAIPLENYKKNYKYIVKSIYKKFENLEYNSKPIHVDPNIDNFIISNEKFYLLDWEYSAMGDPILDLSMIALYSEMNEIEVNSLFFTYFNNDYTYEDFFKYYSYISLGGILWALWAKIKSNNSINFKEYKESMYNYSIKYYKKLNKITKGNFNYDK